MKTTLNKTNIILISIILLSLISSTFLGMKLAILLCLLLFLIYLIITKYYFIKVYKGMKAYKIENYSNALENYRDAALSKYCRTVNHQVGDIFVCRKFIDRDMQKMKEFGLECEIDSSALLEEKGYCTHWTEHGICNTGDGFLTELTHVSGDVVDMEAYAQAFVCRSKEIPFISVKYVTDIIGQNSVKHWEDKLADARQGLSHYFNVLKERI